MRTKRKLRPGDPGTKKYVKTYGNDLVCIRYRYDEEKQIRYTTVELIIESGPMKNRIEKEATKSPLGYVFLKISPDEDALIEQVKLFGAVWNDKVRLWEMEYNTVLELNLLDYIVNL